MSLTWLLYNLLLDDFPGTDFPNSMYACLIECIKMYTTVLVFSRKLSNSLLVKKSLLSACPETPMLSKTSCHNSGALLLKISLKLSVRKTNFFLKSKNKLFSIHPIKLSYFSIILIKYIPMKVLKDSYVAILATS